MVVFSYDDLVDLMLIICMDEFVYWRFVSYMTTRNFGTHQLPPYSFIVPLDDDRNNDSLHFIWRWFFDAIHIALNVFHVTCLIVATCRSFMGWLYEWGFLSFSTLTSRLSLQKPLISLFGLLSSPSFWVFSFHFLVSSSLSFSPLMFDRPRMYWPLW